MSDLILTWDEIEKERPAEKFKQPAMVEKPLPEAVKKDDIEYLLMYPDNSATDYHNGVYKVNIAGKEISLEINSGVIITDSIAVCDILKRQGFVFMYDRPKEQT